MSLIGIPLTITATLGLFHQLSLTAFGAPQTHYKRNSNYGGLTIEGWQTYGRQYMLAATSPSPAQLLQ